MAEQDLLPGLLSCGRDSGGDVIAGIDRNSEKADLLLLRIESEEYVFEEWVLDEEGHRDITIEVQG